MAMTALHSDLTLGQLPKVTDMEGEKFSWRQLVAGQGVAMDGHIVRPTS